MSVYIFGFSCISDLLFELEDTVYKVKNNEIRKKNSQHLSDCISN